MKTVFFGTPALAVPYLEKLAQISSVQAVITSPDQPAGRGYEIKAPAVKEAALRLGMPVHQPSTLKDAAFADSFRALGVEVAIVVAYGKLIPRNVLEAAREGFLNAHFSLLPKYRGAAPMQWALVNGETETGVTLFWLDEGMDTGPVFLQEKTPITSEDTVSSLEDKLVPLGVRLMEEGIAKLKAGKKCSAPQTGEASHARIIRKEDGAIDWNQPALSIVNKLRGFAKWPGVYTHVAGQLVKIKKAKALSGSKSGQIGEVVSVESGVGPVIKCGQGQLVLEEVQPESKKPMSGLAFWNGARLKLGEKLR